MNCLNVDLSRVGNMSVGLTRIGGLDVRLSRVSDFKVRVGLVCGTSLGEYGIIWSCEGKLITIEGGYLIGA